MKFRSTLFIAIIALFLTACNMSLAEDVTPPPGAAQPAQPQPTMGPLFPAQAPDYPVVWLVKGKGMVPWGERIQLN